MNIEQVRHNPMRKRAKKDMHIMLSRNVQQAEIRFKELEHLIVKYTKQNKKSLEGHLRRAIGQRNEFQSFLCANGVLIGHPMNLTKIERDKYWISDCDNGLDRWVSRPLSKVDDFENTATYAKEPNEAKPFKHSVEDSESDEKYLPLVYKTGTRIYYERSENSGFWPIRLYYNKEGYMDEHYLEDIDEAKESAASDAVEIAYADVNASGKNFTVVLTLGDGGIGWYTPYKCYSENPHAKLREPLGTTDDILRKEYDEISEDDEKEGTVHWVDEIRPDTEFETVISNTIRTENGALFNIEMDNKGKGVQLSNRDKKPGEANLIYLTHKDLKQVIKVLNDTEDYMAVCADGKNSKEYTNTDTRGAGKKALDEYYDSLKKGK